MNTNPLEISAGQVDEAYENAFKSENVMVKVVPLQLGVEIASMCSRTTTL
jgi:hypothetical protein